MLKNSLLQIKNAKMPEIMRLALLPGEYKSDGVCGLALAGQGHGFVVKKLNFQIIWVK